MSQSSNFVREKIFKRYSQKFKQNRKDLFYKYLTVSPEDRVLDFGGYDGSWLAFLIPSKGEELYVADIATQALETANKKYGFKTILLDESGKIPFEDNYFDVIFCNSVIEHVTVDKDEIYKIKTNREFKEKSFARQKFLADEIRRVSKKYFVQTPYRHFFIESHTWFPSFFIYLPRTFQIKLIQLLSKYWVKSSTPDVNLLTVKDMRRLFPEAEIIQEKSFFMTKSLIAIKK